ncbi:MAG: preprotein translocase subunit SecY [Christensenellaceae bacterium]
MFETLKNAFKIKEIRHKIWMTLLFLLIFRIGCYIPVPGLDRSQFASVIGGNDFLNLMSSITGGALAQGTLFALGIGPYINASIIMQLLSVGIPYLEQLSKQGEEGRKKISQYTRFLTIILAVIQSIGIIVNFANSSGAVRTEMFFGQMWVAGIYMTIIYTAGSCLCMWLGERITEYGIGNGISMVIFVGILATAGQTLLSKFAELFGGDINALWEIIAFFALSVVIFFLIVTVDLSERRVPVHYQKMVRGNKMYGGQSSNIPMKISGSGVMPLIFAFSIISFPSMVLTLVPAWSGAATWWSEHFAQGNWVYVLVLSLLIFGFSFFYAQIQFNPDDVSKSIQGNGGFIQGIRPGKPTSVYLRKINNRITLFGAIYLTLIAFVPSFVFSWASYDLVNVFSTTGILIIVSVALELDKQLQSQLMMKNAKRGFLK